MFEKKITDEEKKQIEKEAKKAQKQRKREGKKSQRKNGISLKAVVLPLLLAAIVVSLIYIVMRHQEEVKILETTMVTAREEIAANTFVKTKDVDKYFDIIEVDSTKVPRNIYTSYKDFPSGGFYVENAMIEKQPVFTDDITKTDEVMDKYIEGTSKTSIAVDALANSVSGTIRKGNIVDLYAVDPSTDSLTLILEDVYVEAAYNSSGEKIIDDGIAVVFTIRVAPDEKEAINTAISYGGIQLYLTGK